MIAAVLLVLVAILYRVVLGVAGAADMQWMHNFSPMAAIILCSAAFFPKRTAILLPLLAFFASDLILNASYGVSMISVKMLPQYLALGLIAALGWKLRGSPTLGRLLGASLAGSIAFYLITNSADWLAEPLYAKNAAGWVQALTTGLPGYPPTLAFFRNTAASDLIFTLAFVGCMARQPRKQSDPAPERTAELVSR